MPAGEARNPSHIYAAILRKAIQERCTLDQLHLSDVLMALRNAGYDQSTGLGSFHWTRNPMSREANLKTAPHPSALLRRVGTKQPIVFH